MILKKQYFVNNEVENDCFNVNNNMCVYNMFSYNTTVIIILRGDKMENTLLSDFMKIFKSINCDSLYCNCNDCSNKKLCDTVEDVIKSIGDLYNEKK